MAESNVYLNTGQWVLVREIATGAGADSSFLTPSNFPDTLTAAQGNSAYEWPGSVFLPEASAGVEHVALLIDTDGAPVAPSGNYSWRIAERWDDGDSNDAGSQEITAVGEIQSGTVGVIQESVSSAAWRGQARRVAIEITTDFADLPGGSETHIQIWMRAR